jgi:hypothetical protein
MPPEHRSRACHGGCVHDGQAAPAKAVVCRGVAALPLGRTVRVTGLALLLLAPLLGCSTIRPTGAQPAGSAKEASTIDSTNVGDALASPLQDLNLVRVEIPPILLDAQRAPYATPAKPHSWSCEALAQELALLDAALGPDLDAPVPVESTGLIDKGTQAVGDAALGAVRGAAQGLLPFRVWLRKLSGAQKHESDVVAARAAGSLRRAFLKGVAWHQRCTSTSLSPSPTSPNPSPPPPAP